MRAYDANPDKRGNPRAADLFDIGTGTAEILALRWDDVVLDALPHPTLRIRGRVLLDGDGKVFV